ncbi:MAG: methyltransferase domain-containing protein [Candidatus Scalindua sp.]|nr:methyltransferase domain-containing protein [Candidatus Scalindua sp.]
MKEEEIRPQAIFDEYLKLAHADTKAYFENATSESIKCPACNTKGDHAFNKSGFDYELCSNCSTLYVSPRPVNEAFNRYYTEASSVEYWATTFYKVTADARRKKLWKPKAKLIQQAIKRFGTGSEKIIDIGGGYGIFAEEMKILSGNAVTVIEPGPHLASSCRDRNINVVEKFLEDVKDSDLPDSERAFVSFELFEHLHDPGLFLKQLSALMRSGDLFIFTTLSGTGLDIQALWEDSKSVSPPHHLNFLNPHSMKLLLERVGLQPLEVTTPGKLDIDILSNNHELIKDRFLKTFVAYATDAEKQKWQQMISDSGWSSHMMICCQKP